MSRENVKKFFEELEKNEDLKKNFMDTMKEFTGKTNAEAPVKMIKAAKDAGFPFTDGDLREFWNDLMPGANGELSDGDLQAVVGGGLDSDFARWVEEMFLRLRNGKKLFGDRHLD